jgi:2-polyprenyl-3-methyl-5-hydroxy-6-metoxy-1,4-benzoquinol methylase
LEKRVKPIVGIAAQGVFMTFQAGTMTKSNVQRFDSDVLQGGSYVYTAERLSARTANARISDAVAEAFDFRGQTVLDVGCGDGAYTVEFPSLGARKVLGIDPASLAVQAATARSELMKVSDVARFAVGNIYELDPFLTEERFDCILVRGVLHHLPDPERAISGLSSFDGTVVIVEPNGNNPILKLLERYSKYHVEHEERSFSPMHIRTWLRNAGFEDLQTRMINLVPFFCPDWMVPPLRHAERIVERLPLVRDIGCGQSVIVARKRAS